MHYVLGINSGVGKHDGSAALLLDGSIVCLIEQERITRRKSAWGQPACEAIACCLAMAGIDLSAVSLIAFGWDEAAYARNVGSTFVEEAFLEKVFPKQLFGHIALAPRHYVPHHLAHAASAYWTSGFDDAAIMVMDARGETASTSLATASAGRIEIFEQLGLSESLGNYYALAAEWCGLGYDGAGKLMGLAAYGKCSRQAPLFLTPAGYAFHPLHERRPKTDAYYHVQKAQVLRAFGKVPPYRQRSDEDVMAYADFAATAQDSLESAAQSLSVALSRHTKHRNLCLAGGVALNCSMNGRLAESGLWNSVFAPPFAGDCGTALGAALYAWHCVMKPDRKRRERLSTPYLGISYSSDEVGSAVRASGLPYDVVLEDQLIDNVVRRLLANQIVGWFNGRAEVGPRALGARSILSNPCDREALHRVNRLKGREAWRPLAISIIEEAYDQFFERRDADFMIMRHAVRPEMRNRIPATVHVDGSSRPHIVRQSAIPKFWRLLQGFGAHTGVAGVVNTSFNLKGEPIVHSPEQAIAVFERSELDVLAIENFLLVKDRIPAV